MSIRNNISYHNSESPESTLNVKYKYKEGTKTLELNQKHMHRYNNILPKINSKSSLLRQQHFNSYTNENMDFFRLDYLKECDRNHFHNKYMNNLTPINRNENFDKLKEAGEKIKYIDSIKNNFLLKSNKINNNMNKDEFFKDNLYTSEKMINNNFYKKVNNKYTNESLSNNHNYNNNYETPYNISNKRFGRFNNIFNNVEKEKINKNISIDVPLYSGAYLSNMNDYSIHENHCSTPYNMKNNSKNISKLSILSKQSHLFCKEAINNDNPTLFFKVYDYNFKKDGFKKQNNIFSDYAQNLYKGGYFTRELEPNINNGNKGNYTPSKKINLNENLLSFSTKK